MQTSFFPRFVSLHYRFEMCFFFFCVLRYERPYVLQVFHFSACLVEKRESNRCLGLISIVLLARIHIRISVLCLSYSVIICLVCVYKRFTMFSLICECIIPSSSSSLISLMRLNECGFLYGLYTDES